METIVTMSDIDSIRSEFPILKQSINGESLVYFDNAATTQKPKQVIESVSGFYSKENANVHRGVHLLSQNATTRYESVRVLIKNFINATHQEEIIFTKGTTDSINLLASSFGKTFINEGDEIIITQVEHHSNIVPWQILCNERKARLKVIPINEQGDLLFEAFQALLSSKTKLVAITHVSNTLGNIYPIKKFIAEAHKYNAAILIDGAQAVSHFPVDVEELDCDFYCFSGHKMFAPTGVGVLYGKKEYLEKMPPYQGGGAMIKTVTFEHTEYEDLPAKFEAGTPNIAGVIGLGEAVKYINNLSWKNIISYENELLKYVTQELSVIPGIRLLGNTNDKVGVFSFVIDHIHPFDIGTILDQMGIAIRTGHHCTQPLMDFYGISGTCRVSLAFYNTFEEVDKLAMGLKKVIKILQ